MTSIAEIQEAILSLPSEEYVQLRQWSPSWIGRCGTGRLKPTWRPVGWIP